MMYKHVLTGSVAAAIVFLMNAPAQAQNFPQREACQMAQGTMRALLPRLAFPSMAGGSCGGDHSAHTSYQCTDFESDSARGWAQISIPYTNMACYNQTQQLNAIFIFQHYDQGWKITSYQTKMQ